MTLFKTATATTYRWLIADPQTPGTLSVGGAGGSGTVVSAPLAQPNGSINCGSTCSAKFRNGTTVTLTATPAAGRQFLNWTGAYSGTQLTCSVTITKDTSVTANFK